MTGSFRDIYDRNINMDVLVKIITMPIDFQDKSLENKSSDEILEELSQKSVKADENLKSNIHSILIKYGIEDSEKLTEKVFESVLDYTGDQKENWVKFTILCLKKIHNLYQ